MKVKELNHVALHVADLAASDHFYEQVLGLERMDRPDFDFPGRWYRLGTTQELHLIARDPSHDTPPVERHYALLIDDDDAFARRLDEHDVEYRGPRPRPDGATQIFLRDPDGHVIELCTAPPDSA
ncbi:MAG: VOC family protein [Phycisphaeraceae bacterium]|nr:VOC family protein [Phycisphaeraceae bacterium]